MAHIAPAMCAVDYLFGECSNHWFLRESTIATGGEVCDCHYVSKKAATLDEIRRSEENKKSEALRGGGMAVRFLNMMHGEFVIMHPEDFTRKAFRLR